MPSIIGALNIATKALLTSQTAMGTIAHNVSNTNTEGYSRQRVITEAESTQGFGSGVRIADIQRVVSERLVSRISDQIGITGFNSIRYEYMKDMEVVFGLPTSDTSLDKILNNLFDEMNVLSGAPDSSSQQLNVVQNMLFVTDTLNTMSTDIQSVQSRLDTEIDNEIVAINSAIIKIFDLNNEITALQLSGLNGGNPNDLLDARQKQVEIIAEKLSINTNIDKDGRMRVLTESGRRLVDTSYTQIERIPGVPYADIGVRSIQSDGTPGPSVFPILLDSISYGSIKGMVDIRDNFLPGLDAQIDELATVMIREFNLLHGQGSGIPPQATYLTGNGANITAAGADLFLATELNLTPGTSFDISVVDQTNGQPIATTLPAGGGVLSIDIPAVGPFSLIDLAALINGNPDVGALVTATVTVDALGQPALQIDANNAGEAIVMANNTGNPLGELGLNNLLTGTDATDISVRADIQATPSLLATAKMRTSDGGLSFNDNQNIVDLAQMADTEFSFAAAGGLGNQTDSITGYFITLLSNFAVSLADTNDRTEFSETILDDLKERLSAQAGVNQDEELSNLLVFQNSFQASARIISIMDEMLETIVNMV
jgi:flagellar hook-associated protein 1 FlgK